MTPDPASEPTSPRNQADPTGADGPIEAIIAAYLAAEDRDDHPDRSAIITAHPDLADALGDFFREHDRFARLAAPLGGADDFTVSLNPGAGTASESLPPTLRYFGDYELEAVIGQGGMGVVYRARQLSLNRPVAVKMLRAGVLATDDDLRRFQNEAEAVALLDHPRIVPIHEVGRHDDRPYFAMKLVSGTSLDKALAPFATNFRGTAELVALIAEAVHHAHQRGILHRDLKPANILLDPEGQPYVTDFGLAKRVVADAELTHSGAILGTPAYMAPEQASRQRGLVTTATDVYGLGAILYALLTGQSPFRGESIPDTLHQVLTSPPPSPTRLNPLVPRDLATICLKCLDKDPRRRYPSAEALAADLRRYLQNEPITARPTGPAERLLLWTRRNKVVAALVATVAASLLVGITASTYFALRESHRAQAEHTQRTRAEEAEKATIRERDATEQTLAQSLVGPLDPTAEGKGVLSQPEADSLWRLSSVNGDRLWYRFLDEATRNPTSARQLRGRSEPALIAAVGLSRSKRLKARAMLLERVDDLGLRLTQRVDIALIALELEQFPDFGTDKLVTTIKQGLEADLHQQQRDEWNNHLLANAQRFEPSTAVQLLSTAASLQREQSWPSRPDSKHHRLVAALITATTRMEPAEAVEMLVSNLEIAQDEWDRLQYARTITQVASRIPIDKGTVVCLRACLKITKSIVETLQKKVTWGTNLNEDIEAFFILAERMTGKESIVLQEEIAKNFMAPSGKEVIMELDLISESLASFLMQSCANEGTTLLIEKLKRTGFGKFTPKTIEAICNSLASLTPSQAKDTINKLELFLAHSMNGGGSVENWGWAIDAYEKVLSHMPLDEAVNRLVIAILNDNGVDGRSSQINLMLRFARKLTPTEEVRVLSSLLDKLSNTNFADELTWGLHQAALRLPENEAQAILNRTTPKLVTIFTNHEHFSTYNSSHLLPGGEEITLSFPHSGQEDRYPKTEMALALMARADAMDPDEGRRFRLELLEKLCDGEHGFKYRSLDVLLRQREPERSMEALNLVAKQWEEKVKLDAASKNRFETLDNLGNLVVRLGPGDAARVIELLITVGPQSLGKGFKYLAYMVQCRLEELTLRQEARERGIALA